MSNNSSNSNSGAILAGILVFTLQKSGALKSMRAALEH